MKIRTSHPRTSALAAMALLSPLALAGCAGTATSGGSPDGDASGNAVIGEKLDSVPNSAAPQDPASFDPAVGWIDVGESFYVTTYGSSSCPLAPTSVTASGERMDVEVTAQGGQMCTKDMAPTSYGVQLPAEFNGNSAIDVRLVLPNADPINLSLAP